MVVHPVLHTKHTTHTNTHTHNKTQHTGMHTHTCFSMEFSFLTPDVCSTTPTDQRQKCGVVYPHSSHFTQASHERWVWLIFLPLQKVSNKHTALLKLHTHTCTQHTHMYTHTEHMFSLKFSFLTLEHKGGYLSATLLLTLFTLHRPDDCLVRE